MSECRELSCGGKSGIESRIVPLGAAGGAAQGRPPILLEVLEIPMQEVCCCRIGAGAESRLCQWHGVHAEKALRSCDGAVLVLDCTQLSCLQVTGTVYPTGGCD